MVELTTTIKVDMPDDQSFVVQSTACKGAKEDAEKKPPLIMFMVRKRVHNIEHCESIALFLGLRSLKGWE